MEAAVSSRLETPARALGEIALGYSLILITVWTPRPLRDYFALAAALWISGALIISGPNGSANLGFGLGALRRSAWVVSLAFAAGAVVILIAAWLGTLHVYRGTTGYRPPMVGYLVWAFVQQMLLQHFLMARLLVLLRRPWPAIAAATALFAVAHFPSLVLVPATLLWGAASCWLFLRYRSLIAVALIHFALGACLAVCVPATVHRNMRVGIGYLRYHAPATRASAMPAAAAGVTPAVVQR